MAAIPSRTERRRSVLSASVAQKAGWMAGLLLTALVVVSVPGVREDLKEKADDEKVLKPLREGMRRQRMTNAERVKRRG